MEIKVIVQNRKMEMRILSYSPTWQSITESGIIKIIIIMAIITIIMLIMKKYEKVEVNVIMIQCHNKAEQKIFFISRELRRKNGKDRSLRKKVIE